MKSRFWECFSINKHVKFLPFYVGFFWFFLNHPSNVQQVQSENLEVALVITMCF